MRVAVVGAGTGLGLACARAFARHGAKLLLADVDPAALQQATRELGCHGLFCDVTSEASVAIFAADVERAYWPPDVLITAAGRSYVRTLGTMRVTRALIPLMKADSGPKHIVNSAELDPVAGPDCTFPYARSAHAFEALATALAEQLKGTNIDLMTILPESGQTAVTEAGRWFVGRQTPVEIVAEELVTAIGRASRDAATVEGNIGKPRALRRSA